MIFAFAMLLTAQDAYSDPGQHFLDRMSADISGRVAKCEVKVTFFVKPGGMVKDAQAVIESKATPNQVSCAKGLVSWLMAYDEARQAGFVK